MQSANNALQSKFFLEQTISSLDNSLVCDSDGSLKMYHYKTTEPTQDQYQIRGVVTDMSGHVVARSFPFTPEHVITDMSTSYPFDVTQTTFIASYEGSIIRVYFYNDSWHISTHKKLDAFKSNWSTNLGGAFKYVIEMIAQKSMTDVFDDLLDKAETHVFILRPNYDNFIANKPPATPNEIICHVGSFTADGFKMPSPSYAWFVPQQFKFSTGEELGKFVCSIDVKESVQGIFAITPDFQFYKFVNSEYREMSLLRGNEPNVMARYITLFNTDEKTASVFRQKYPVYAKMFQLVHERVPMLIKFIYTMYVKRYIKHMYAPVPRVIYPFQANLHEIYKATQKSITFELVKAEMKKCDSRWVAKMISTPFEVETVLPQKRIDTV